MAFVRLSRPFVDLRCKTCDARPAELAAIPPVCVSLFFVENPGASEGSSLLAAIEDRIAADGVIGIGALGVGAAVLGGVVATLASSRR